MPLKKPWIPPPGKSAKMKKADISKLRTDATSKDIQEHPPSSHHPITLKEKETESCFRISTIALPDTCRNESDVNMSFYEQASYSLPKEMKIEEIYLILQELKNENINLQLTRSSFRAVLDVFHRPLFASVAEDLTINQMISRSDLLINQFFDVCNEFENHIASSDHIPRYDTAKLIAHINIIRTCKGRLHSKLLQAYDHVTSTLKFIIEVMQQKQFSTLFKDYDTLKDKIEFLQDSFLEREEKIKVLEDKLHKSKQKIQMLKKEKSMSESLQYHSEKQTINNHSEIYVRPELHAYKPDPKLIAENVRLLKAYTDVTKTAESEITALKKALAIRKNSSDHYQSTSNQLQEKLNKKEQEILKLGLERDNWKSKLTSANNKLVEAESQIEYFKKVNEDLKEELNSLKESHKTKLTQMEMTIHEKSLQLDTVTNEKSELNEAFSGAEKLVLASQNEIKLLQEKYASLEAKLDAQINCTKSVKLDSENEILLIPLLQELKDSLSAVREKGFHQIQESNGSENKKLSEENLLGLVKEIKNLIETKEVHHNSVEQNITNQQIASVENKLQMLQNKCDREIAEKERRLQQLHEQMKLIDVKYSTTKNVAFEGNSNLMNLENSDQNKMSSLKEELKKKNLELALVNRKHLEDRNKYESELQDLKNELNRVTSNYESLQKYVKLLKSSYTKVFDS